MKIGILSDTHGTLPEEVFTYFKECDEIWHAGDIGNLQVTQRLAAFKRLRAVHGNIDSQEIRYEYPKSHSFTCEGVRIVIIHIAGTPPHYNTLTRRLIDLHKPDILVCGHTHLALVQRNPGGLLHINPGAIGNHGIHPIRTLMRMTITLVARGVWSSSKWGKNATKLITLYVGSQRKKTLFLENDRKLRTLAT